MNDRMRVAGYRALARERAAQREAEERAERESTEVVAMMPSRKSIVGNTLAEVGDQLVELGYKMHKAKPGVGRLIVPHKDGVKEASVRVRVKKDG